MAQRRYDTILWDVDGTLLNFKKSMDYAIRGSFDRYGIKIDAEIVEAYSRINDSYWERLERGEIKKQEVLLGRFITLFEELSPGGSLESKQIDPKLLEQIDPQAFQVLHQRRLGSVYYYQDDSIRLCQKLKEQGFLQYIITNGVAWTQSNKLRLAGFDRVMDGIFISDEIGFNKPDPCFFEECFARIAAQGGRIERSRTLVVGDSQTSDMQGARNMHMDCCLYLGSGAGQETAAGSADVTYAIHNLWELEDILCQSQPIKN